MPAEFATSSLPGTSKMDLDTPAFIVNLDLMEKNIHKMASYFRDKPTRLRPHVKHHKTPAIAHQQIDAGAIGICCQKLGEAEVMVDAGIKNVLVTYEVIGKVKLSRLMSLCRRATVMVIVDDPDNVQDLSEAAQAFGVRVGVLIDVDSGQNRCGVLPGESALRLAHFVARSSALEFKGIHGYEGHLQSIQDFEERASKAMEAMEKVVETANAIRTDGIPVDIVSAGGTGTYNITGAFPGITEVQAGSYVLMDAAYRRILEDFDVAGTVLATVMSRPTVDRAVLDCGMKAISTDQWPPQVIGLPGVDVGVPSDEHLTLTLTDSDSRQLRIGDKVELIAGHNDTTVNLHSYLFGVRGVTLENVWEVGARGRIR